MFPNQRMQYKRALKAVCGAYTFNYKRYADLIKERLGQVEFVRIAIIHTKSGGLEVIEIKYGRPSAPYSVSYKSLGEFDDRVFAEDKFDEACTIKGTIGFALIDDVDVIQHNFIPERMTSQRIGFSLAADFYANNKPNANALYTQKIQDGIHVCVKIDAFGDIYINDINTAHYASTASCISNPNAISYLNTIKSVPGFRGALMEGFLNKDGLHIIDAGYFHDIDMRLKSLEKRRSILKALLSCHDIDGGSRYIVPQIVDPKEWLTTNRFKAEKSQLIRSALQPFIFYQNTTDNNGTLISEAKSNEVISNKIENGVISLSLVDDFRARFDAEYPSDRAILASEYCAIGLEDKDNKVLLFYGQYGSDSQSVMIFILVASNVIAASMESKRHPKYLMSFLHL